jgi:hypothetical protein
MDHDSSDSRIADEKVTTSPQHAARYSELVRQADCREHLFGRGREREQLRGSSESDRRVASQRLLAPKTDSRLLKGGR